MPPPFQSPWDRGRSFLGGGGDGGGIAAIAAIVWQYAKRYLGWGPVAGLLRRLYHFEVAMLLQTAVGDSQPQ